MEAGNQGPEASPAGWGPAKQWSTALQAKDWPCAAIRATALVEPSRFGHGHPHKAWLCVEMVKETAWSPESCVTARMLFGGEQRRSWHLLPDEAAAPSRSPEGALSVSCLEGFSENGKGCPCTSCSHWPPRGKKTSLCLSVLFCYIAIIVKKKALTSILVLQLYGWWWDWAGKDLCHVQSKSINLSSRLFPVIIKGYLRVKD